MNIGELAQRSGISTKAICNHERIGVLSPPPRSSAGYRVYGQRLPGELTALARRGERLDPRDCLPSCVFHIISRP